MTIFVCRSVISHILPTICGNHRFFIIAIYICECNILILGILRFGLSRLYIYTHYLFSFGEICNPEQDKVIAIYSPTPGWQVIKRSFRYYSMQLIPWLLMFRASIASFWSPYKRVSALYWYFEYYGLVYIINIYTHDLFLFYKYSIHNNKGWLLVVVSHQVKR